ncbi:hypothetical protein [Peribacillus simplex]|uniref:hypothetical protein n=1 Tax=Peribacillus simplex TaxID=1478 RepID=UPI0024C1C1E0|nr:hypothetical protein [Peribacillus simplex]WHY58659.1 hypothetical protein QNH43_10565 [Peribacillus simplex]
MRKNMLISLFALLMGAFLMVGCSDEKVSNSEGKEEKATPAEQKKVSNEPETEPKEDENGNVVLTEVGHKTKGEDGTTVELLKIKDVNQNVNIDPIKLTIKDLKVIQMTNVSKDSEEFLLQYTNGTKLPEKLNYLQIQYTAENTEDKNIGWNGIQKIVTNTGEQLDASGNDFIWEENGFDGTFYGKTKHEGTIAVITKSDPNQLKNVKFIIGSTFNPDNYEDITPEQQTQFDF